MFEMMCILFLVYTRRGATVGHSAGDRRNEGKLGRIFKMGGNRSCNYNFVGLVAQEFQDRGRLLNSWD